MDREIRENYTVVIQAKDMGGQLGGLAGTTTVNVALGDINDNPPMFDQSKSSSVLSLSPLPLVHFPLYVNPHHPTPPPANPS